MRIRELTPADASWAEAVVTEHFGSPRVVSRGVVHDLRRLPGLVAERDDERLGLLQYQIEGSQCEIVVLVSLVPRQGVGRRLLGAARETAKRFACDRIWLVTTNDNLAAQKSYVAAGARLVAVHEGAVREARRLKPEIPEVGESGVPIEDEIEFEIDPGDPAI